MMELGRRLSDSGREILSSVRREHNVVLVLTQLETSALSHFAVEDLPAALTDLKKSEALLEQLSTQGQTPDKDTVLSLLTNLACCYQR